MKTMTYSGTDSKLDFVQNEEDSRDITAVL